MYPRRSHCIQVAKAASQASQRCLILKLKHLKQVLTMIRSHHHTVKSQDYV